MQSSPGSSLNTAKGEGGGGVGGSFRPRFCFCGGIRARRFDRCLPLMVACTATKIGVKHFLGGKMVFWHNRN